MPAFKAIYGILLFLLVLYLVIYGFIVRKLFVVKIYFETAKTVNTLLQKDSAFDSTLSDKHLSSGVELSSWNKSSLRNLVERIPETLDNVKDEIVSFLEDLGVKVNEADISSIKKPTTPPPQVNPNGASLPNLIRKMDKRFNFSAYKPCPNGHLSKGKLVSRIYVIIRVHFHETNSRPYQESALRVFSSFKRSWMVLTVLSAVSSFCVLFFLTIQNHHPKSGLFSFVNNLSAVIRITVNYACITRYDHKK